MGPFLWAPVLVAYEVDNGSLPSTTKPMGFVEFSSFFNPDFFKGTYKSDGYGS